MIDEERLRKLERIATSPPECTTDRKTVTIYASELLDLIAEIRRLREPHRLTVEVAEENADLKAAVASLDSENAELRLRIIDLKKDLGVIEANRLTDRDNHVRIEAEMLDTCEAKVAELNQLRKQVAELEARPTRRPGVNDAR